MKLNKYIDHTLLKQDATENQIDCLLSEAREYDFASVCVNPTWVEYAKKGLKVQMSRSVQWLVSP